MIRRAKIARELQQIARSRGFRPSFRLCYRIVAAANSAGVSAPVLMALVEQECGFSFIFGHDLGGLFPGEKVTQTRYRQLQEHLRSSKGPGANGVGYSQATYYTFILENDALWRPKHNLRWGGKYQRELIDQHGLEGGFNAYNGDPTGAYGRTRREITAAYGEALS